MQESPPTFGPDGAPATLGRREFDLLAALPEHPGRVFTRAQLLAAAWGTTYVSEKTVDVHIANLRRKLGDAIEITALRGVGYRVERRCSRDFVRSGFS